MDRTYPCELTCLCLINCHQKLLVMQKTDSEFEPSLTFPGGHVEPHESVTAAAIREIHEETGLHVTTPQLCGFVNFDRRDGRKEFIYIYQITVERETPTRALTGTKNEGTTLWLPITQIRKFHLNAVISAVLETYLHHVPRELYFPKQDA
ncbi:NUDIX domain-containing protein [Pediococcus siamensis]|uniref:NUDIX domain-containing protein n=1 Tax=Pediococcus siamensis TaxID=381829 RepID=UPI0039A3900D